MFWTTNSNYSFGKLSFYKKVPPRGLEQIEKRKEWESEKPFSTAKVNCLKLMLI
jgi:hypothetical protein